MKKKVKKLVSMFVVASLVLSLAACGTSGEKKEAEITTTNKEIVLKIPTFWVGENVGRPYFDECVERFNAKYDGQYRVEKEAVVEATYTEKIKQMIQSGNTPALVHDLDKEFRETVLIDNNLYYPMNEFVEEHTELKKWYFLGALDSMTLDNGDIVAIPLVRTDFMGLFVNESQYQSNTPISEQTMEEFLGSLKEETFAFQTVNNAWLTALFFSALISSQEGGMELMEEYATGSTLYDWNQPSIKAAAEEFVEIWKNHAASNSVGADYADAINTLTSNNATFVVNGNWMNSQIEDGNAANWSNGFNGNDMSAYALPGNVIVSDSNHFGRWVVLKDAPEDQIEAALAFLDFINTQDELESWLLQEGGLIMGMDYSEEFLAKLSENKLLTQQLEALNGDVNIVINVLKIMPDSIANQTFGNLITQLVTEKITADEFCQQMTFKVKEATQ